MGTKYTIEVEDKPFELLSEDGFTSEKLYRVKGFNSLVFDWNGLNMLTPYTEPDLEQVRKEGYEKGLSDAWDAAKKIQDTGGNLNWWIHHVSAPEAIEKIRQYEQEKEEQFHVGDEFENESGKRFVIIKMNGNKIDRYVDEEGKTYCLFQEYRIMRKTGRHFPEIAEVLQKMKES